MSSYPEYRYGGARAMVILHEQHLRNFWETWKAARDAGVILPETDDPDYASMETLSRHVLRCAGGYLRWICEQLDLPLPEFRSEPSYRTVEEAESFLEHILEQWRHPLANVPERRFYEPEYPSKWGTRYCVDSMLEHAVMHPIRHRFQLVELMDE